MIDLAEKFVLFALERQVADRKQLQKVQREFSRENKIPFLANDAMVRAYHNLVSKEIIKANERFLKLVSLKSTRSDSGIVVVSVLTKPYDCPGNCLYCPSEDGAPKSYLDQEPAVMRAKACNYDPYLQVESRLRALDAVGHITDKVNIRIIGGTWSYYPKDYREWFVEQLFRAANNCSELKVAPLCQGYEGQESGKSKEILSPVIPEQSGIQDSRMDSRIKPEDDNIDVRDNNLEKFQQINETAKHRIVEISVETRQDYINKDEILHLRKLGVTKVELGVQSIYDDVLTLNRRGSLNADAVTATKLLKEAGFKVSYQVMLNLPGSDFDRDLSMFREIFSNPDFMPDHLKIYPLALVKEAPIIELYNQGKYKPYTKDELISLLKKIKVLIPSFCRVERVIRDIPTDYIVEGGSKVSNLRQHVLAELKADGLVCKCIRCREIKSNFEAGEDAKLLRIDYDASDGKEIFLSYETGKRELYSMLRLRINNEKIHFISSLSNAAIIREIHTYGSAVEIGELNSRSPQHQGYGKKLVAEAERIAKEEFGLDKIAVIAGVGVRDYFRKLGYELEDTYMIKKL